MATSTTLETTEAVAPPAPEAAASSSPDVPTATFASLIAKPARTLAFTVTLTDSNGDDVVLRMKYKALSSRAYDALVSANPPSAKDRTSGGIYNVDSFAPALIAAVSLEPSLTVEQATQIYTSSDWSGGEIGSLFFNAQRVCNAGLDIPFNDRG